MLPGGITPVTQLIAMIRSTPPQGAVGLLKAMPADRLGVVIAAMGSADIARLLPVAPPDFGGTLLDALSVEQLIKLLRTDSTDRAVGLLLMLPYERLSAVVEGLPDDEVVVLLTRLPVDGQTALLAAMDPRRGYAALSRRYEQDVADALARANLDVTVPPGAPSGVVLVQGLGWHIVVAAHYGDDGRIALRDAEEGAYRLRANGALSVTDHQPAEDVVRYCRESQREGRLVDAATWIDARYDGSLTRTLVSLFQ
jgi:hypothetical protein